jgi:hypothetical protein
MPTAANIFFGVAERIRAISALKARFGSTSQDLATIADVEEDKVLFERASRYYEY